MKKYVKFLLILVLLIPYVVFAQNIVVKSTYSNGVHIRELASLNSNAKGVLYQNETAIVDSQKVSGAGCDDGWYHIVDGAFKNYYVCSKFVSVVNNNTQTSKIDIYITAANGVNIRNNMSLSSQIVGVASYNTKLTVGLNKTINNECTEGWYTITDGSYAGYYICSKFTTTAGQSTTPSYNKIKMYVSAKNGVNIRRLQSLSSAKMGELKYKDEIEVYDHFVTNSDCTAGWVQIASGNHATRYVCSKWLSKSSGSTTPGQITQRVYITSSTGIYIRQKADSSSTSTGIAEYGASYVVNTTKFSGNGCSTGWYQIVEGVHAADYICSKYTSTTKPSGETPSEPTDTISVYVNATNGVNVRKSTSQSSSRMGVLNYKDEIKVYNTKETNNDCAEGWMKIASGTYKGNFVCSKWLTQKGEEEVRNKIIYITASGGIYIRESASSNAAQIAIAKNGESYIVKEEKITGTGCSNGWFQIASGNYKGKYICSTYTSDNQEATAERITMYVNAKNGVNVRKSTSFDSDKMGVLNYKDEVVVYDAKTTNNDCADGWVKVASGSYSGNYVCSKWLSMKSEQPVGSTKTVYINAKNGVNVRKSTSTKSEKMGELRYNDKVEVYNESTVTNDCSSGWNKIASGTYSGNYICSLYTSESESSSSVNTIKVYVTSSTGIYIRKSASANSSQTGIASYRSSYIVKSEKTSGAGCSNGWYKIAEGSYKNNYICSLHTSTIDPGESSQPDESSNKVYITSPTGIYIRQEPTISSTQMGIAYYGSSYNVRTKKIDGYGCADGWYKITDGEYKNNYICSTKTSFNNPQSGADETDSQNDIYSLVLSKEEKIIMITSNTELKKEASTSSSSNSDLLRNNNYIANETIFVNNSGCSTNIWYKVQIGNVNGYVCSDNAVEGASTDKYVTVSGEKISESVVAPLNVSVTETFLEIDLTKNYARLYRGGFKIFEASISTNINNQKVGTFYVSDKTKNTFKDSLYSNYSINLGQGLYISDADTWKNVYGTYVNNGFIYMPLRAEKIAYETLGTGNKVIVHK